MAKPLRAPLQGLRGLVLACLLCGCGGKVEGAEEPSDPGESSASDAAKKKPGSGTQLGECKLGPLQPSKSCAWLGDGRCYETKSAACNCVCPRDHDSVCWSDFPDGTNPTVVHCE